MMTYKAPSTRSRICLNPQFFFFTDTASVSLLRSRYQGRHATRDDSDNGLEGDQASVHTRGFDSDTLRVDGESFESGKKRLRIQKYPDTSGKGLSSPGVIVHEMYPEQKDENV